MFTSFDRVVNKVQRSIFADFVIAVNIVKHGIYLMFVVHVNPLFGKAKIRVYFIITAVVNVSSMCISPLHLLWNVNVK